MDYKDTLNLPKTGFPMKASLANKEPQRLKAWYDKELYQRILEKRQGAEKYVLHDGPPYANGHLHMGHALNKILKDFVVRIKSAQGYFSPYVPGWDCHGLPIEHQVDKKLGSKKKNMSVSDVRKECRKYADRFIDIQRNEFKRLGVLGDWDNPYVTMDFEYEAVTLGELYKFFNNGGVYKGLKPVHWCTSCVTALAEAEIEYAQHTSDSIFVKFEVDAKTAEEFGIEGEKISVIIWTTTPWTLPANLAVAFHPELEYSFVRIKSSENGNLKAGEIIVVAKKLVEDLMQEFGVNDYEEIKTASGIDFENKYAHHPFYDRKSLMILGEHVTTEQGSGIVHTAPGHGQEDYEVGREYGLEVLNPVDDYGIFKGSLPVFGGKNIFKANPEIVEHMRENGSLIKSSKVEHSYPHCWRCKKPVVFRATPQWFISMENNNLRKNALSEIKKVKWIPSWGEQRITSMIENRPDWCISRQRTWGVPIAVFTCQDCDETIVDEDIQEKVLEAFKKEGADAWFDYSVEDFLGSDFGCSNCGSKKIRKETDILDVWFDSGTSHAAVCEKRDELTWPANMYLEGSDQHRGWFHSSLLESVGSRGKIAYKEVLTHGFVVDGEGRKMSKSVGNVITPDEIVNKYGAEILRLWVSAEDYSEDVRISADIIKRLVESYRKIRNTSRYLLGNLSDFQPDEDMVSYDHLLDLDRYILIKWEKAKNRILTAFDKYQFHTFYHTFINFCINTLSSFYLDILKDRLYTYKADSHYRKSAQTVVFTLMKEMCIIMSPILSFTADEIWEYLPEYESKSEFVFEEIFPKIQEHNEVQLEEKWDKITAVRKEVNKALELARAEKLIGHPLDARVTLGSKENLKDVLTADEGINRIFIISELIIKDYEEISDGFESENMPLKIFIEQAPYEKCERCWVRSDSIGEDEEHPGICSRCVSQVK